jgi:adenosylcobyric acid synthase
MKKALSILGTGSGVGKSLVVAGLCRIFRDMGISVSPFKAQNMALNSFITKEGGEIGRAQALQAEAAKLEPCIHMNPVLLKAQGEAGCQVIFQGRVFASLSAKDYYRLKDLAWERAIDSFQKLREKYQLIILEGAGSPVEINLMEKDIVNLPMARFADAPVLLVGDIDKGGVFASLIGTVKLAKEYASLIKGFLINKFRGDPNILEPGLSMLEGLTGIPTLGIIPYEQQMGLPEEDGVSLWQKRKLPYSPRRELKVVVVHLPFISNFTDFDPLAYEPDVLLSFSLTPSEIESADMVIVPGTKNTQKDLSFLKESGLGNSIITAWRKGAFVVGICGGYQILGREILDPEMVEGKAPEMEGLGLFDIETIFQGEKITSQVYFKPHRSNFLKTKIEQNYWGYEIHMGLSKGMDGIFEVTRFKEIEGNRFEEKVYDGSERENAMGTYIHGIFENDTLRRQLLNLVRKKKGLDELDVQYSYSHLKEERINNLANLLRKNLQMERIYKLVGL